MKKYLLILTTLLMSFSNDPIERLGVKGPLTFGETSFNLAWTDKPNDFYYAQEYLPKGEKVENFDQMLAIHLFEKDIEVDDAVQQKINDLEKRKKTDLSCHYQVRNSPDGKEAMVDCLVSESKDNLMTLVEFIIYRYKKVELGDSKKGILVYVYSKRAYSENIIPFLKSLESDRMKYLNKMMRSKMPDIKINDK